MPSPLCKPNVGHYSCQGQSQAKGWVVVWLLSVCLVLATNSHSALSQWASLSCRELLVRSNTTDLYAGQQVVSGLWDPDCKHQDLRDVTDVGSGSLKLSDQLQNTGVLFHAFNIKYCHWPHATIHWLAMVSLARCQTLAYTEGVKIVSLTITFSFCTVYLTNSTLMSLIWIIIDKCKQQSLNLMCKVQSWPWKQQFRKHFTARSI